MNNKRATYYYTTPAYPYGSEDVYVYILHQHDTFDHCEPLKQGVKVFGMSRRTKLTLADSRFKLDETSPYFNLHLVESLKAIKGAYSVIDEDQYDLDLGTAFYKYIISK